MKMRENELRTWEKARKNGALVYAFKTGTLCTLFVLGLFILTNAYHNYDDLPAYIQYNFVDNWFFTFTVSIITYVGILVMSLILYAFNEYRYRKTINN